VRLGDVYNAAGDAGFLGEYGPQKDGKLRWSAGYQIPRALARIEQLEGDDAGWIVDKLEEGGRQYIQVSAKLQNHTAADTQSAPF
jgi:hypothetical protein